MRGQLRGPGERKPPRAYQRYSEYATCLRVYPRRAGTRQREESRVRLRARIAPQVTGRNSLSAQPIELGRLLLCVRNRWRLADDNAHRWRLARV